MRCNAPLAERPARRGVWAWLFVGWIAVLGGASDAQVAPELPAARYGPRVTYQAQQVTLEEALDAVGRQMNRSFIGNVYRSETRRLQKFDFDLQELWPRDVLAAIEDITGHRVSRTNRFQYSVDAGRTVIGRRGYSLGDWNAWLPMVRYYFYSFLYPGEPHRVTVRAYLTPQLSVEAPNDIEALRLVSISKPTALDEAELELEPLYATSEVREPYSADASQWLVQLPVQAPALGQSMLSRVSFQVTFASELQELVFGFDKLADQTQRVQTIGEYDAVLTHRGEREGRQTWRLSLAGPVPEGLRDRLRQSLQRREDWLDARLYEAGGKPIFTTSTQRSSKVEDETWTTLWEIQPAEGETAVPDRCQVMFYLQGGPGTAVDCSFDAVPLPPLRPEEAPDQG